MKLFDPTSPPLARSITLAPRPRDLRGLRVGLIENTKFNSEAILARLGERLARHYGITVSRMIRKRSPSHAVTVYASNSLCQVYNQLAAEPEPLLRCFADALCNLGTPNLRGFNQSLVVFAGEHADTLRRSGWSKQDVRRFLLEHARRTVADLKRAGRRPGEIEPGDETTWKHAFERLEDILIVCAGGEAGSWSACLPGWGNKWTRSVTTPIDTP